MESKKEMHFISRVANCTFFLAPSLSELLCQTIGPGNLIGGVVGSTVELLLCRKEVPGSVLASVSHGEDQVAGDGDETSAWDPGEQLPVRDN